MALALIFKDVPVHGEGHHEVFAVLLGEPQLVVDNGHHRFVKNVDDELNKSK